MAVNGSDQRTYTQSEWIAVLEQMGYRKTMLLEIPVASDQQDQRFQQAASLLAAGQQHLMLGQSQDAVTKCRQSLESLAAVLGEKPNSNQQICADITNNKGLNKDQRFQAIRRTITNLSNPAAHDQESGPSIEWHYDDAVAVLTMTGVMIRRAWQST